MGREADDRRIQFFIIMEIIKIIVLFSVLTSIECINFQLQESIRNLEDLGRNLEKNPFYEVPSGVFNRILYGRSVFEKTGCPYGTIRIGRNCVPPRSNPDYEYDG